MAGGYYSGGEFYVRSKPDAKQQTQDTNGIPIITDGRLRHGHLPYEGNRCSIVAFTHSSFWQTSEQDKQKLKELGFNCPTVRDQKSPELVTLDKWLSPATGDPCPEPPEPVIKRIKKKNRPKPRAYKPIQYKAGDPPTSRTLPNP